MEKSLVNYIEAFHFFDFHTAAAIWLLVFSFALIVVAAHYLLSPNTRSWPPCPPTLPVLGNLHQLKKSGNFLSARSAFMMARSYGPVMTLWMGTSPLVVLTGQTAIWEALVNQASNFAGRPYMPTKRFLYADQQTIITCDCNERWIRLRKILHKNVLSPFHIASHSSSHQKNVNDLVNTLVTEMQSNNGVVRPLHAFKIMAINFIAQLCFGPDFQEEIFANKLEKFIAEDISLTGRGGTLLDSIPFARYWNPSSIMTEKKGKTLRAGVLGLFLPLIQFGRRYRAYLRKNAPNSFLNCLLSIGEGEEDEDKLNQLSDEEITFNIFELFVLSVDSTSTTIEWALAYLINHPHIQNRVYQEVNEALAGRKEELFRLEDIGKLPYLQAVVKETLRKEGVAPLAVPHQTANECEVMGVNIPARAVVLVNLHSVSHDPQVWREPDAFSPDRFLGHDESDRARSSYLPFGAGRRICAGMDMANVYIPITLANLLKKFEWMSVKEGSPPDLTPEDRSVIMFMKYPLQACIRCR